MFEDLDDDLLVVFPPINDNENVTEEDVKYAVMDNFPGSSLQSQAEVVNREINDADDYEDEIPL